MARFGKTFFVCAVSCLFWGTGALAQEVVGNSTVIDEVQAPEDVPATEGESAEPMDIWERIRRGYAMPQLKGKRVERALRQYARHPHYVEQVAGRAGKYLYHIAEEVEKRGMPTELVLLPFVESAFQPEALSYAKAAGLWQFMPATGSLYSLKQNLWRDDRRDVMESTRAALDYFERLYKMFGDWHLALAAYNWGEGSVLKAVRTAKRRGKKADYSSLRMPYETSMYVPKLLAIKEIISNPEKYGVQLPEIDNEPYFVRVTKSRDIDLETAASLAEMEVEEFRKLNPGFNLPVIVASHNAAILLPRENVEVFVNNLASWVTTGKPLSGWILYPVKEGETLKDIADRAGMSEEELRRVNRIPKGRKVLPGSTLLVDANGQIAPEIDEDALSASLRLSAPEVRRVVYRVHRGDTLFAIALRHGITQKSIRETNHLRTSRLRIGQRLMLVIPPKAKSRVVARPGAKTYRVRSGDTLFSIAKRFDTSVVSLRSKNRLRTSRLRVGQTLIVK